MVSDKETGFLFVSLRIVFHIKYINKPRVMMNELNPSVLQLF